jgi:hypothetical protein
MEEKNIQTQENTTKPEKRPDDTGKISVEGHIRIFDPNTKEKFVEQRA